MAGVSTKSIAIAAVAAVLLACRLAAAEVTDAAAGGFTSVHEALIHAERADTWLAAINDIDRWWNPVHTVSGDGHRLSIDARPQGCFCEKLGDSAGIVHLTVTMVSPGILLRLTGGLGPLGLLGVAGNMTWEFADEGDSTRVKFTYSVGGYRAGGLDAFAAPVDAVTGEALHRLKAFVETGDAEQAGHE